MNYKIYHEGNEYQFTFNYLTTVGDLQTIIIQTLNLNRNQLLQICHNTNILGLEYEFGENLLERDLYDLDLFVVMDYYQRAPGTKNIFQSWLEQQTEAQDLIVANSQLMYFNTLNNSQSYNLNFFTDNPNNNSIDQTITSLRDNSQVIGDQTTQSQFFRQGNSNSTNNIRRSNITLGDNRNNNSTRPTVFGSLLSTMTPVPGTNGRVSRQMSSFSISSNGTNNNIMDQIMAELGNIGNGGDGAGLTDLLTQMMDTELENAIPGGSDFFNYVMNLEPVAVTLSRESLEALPKFNFSEVPDEIKTMNSKNCSICLEDYQDSDEVRVLLCKHIFHTECIDRWLGQENVRCPVCRLDNRGEETKSNQDEIIEDSEHMILTEDKSEDSDEIIFDNEQMALIEDESEDSMD